MKIILDIFRIVWDIAWFFHLLYVESEGIPIVGRYISPLFYSIYRGCRSLCDAIALFDKWVDEVWALVQNIFSIDTIKALLKDWLNWAEWAWDWVRNAWWNIWQVAGEWFETKIPFIQGLIDAATQGFNVLLAAWDSFWTITWPQWTSSLEALRGEWDNFWTVIFPTLFDISYAEQWWKGKFLDISKAITDAFTERESWWAGWQDMRDQVVRFFTSPLDFLLDRFAGWFLGPEE